LYEYILSIYIYIYIYIYILRVLAEEDLLYIKPLISRRICI
jgi:hypothetical protein